MFKRKTKKRTNWWQTSDWEDKIEHGRLHIYTWLMVHNDDDKETASKGCWDLLKKNAKGLTGLEYRTSSKWTKVDGGPAGLPTPSGDSKDKGWHLRQLKIRAVTSEEGWKSLDDQLNQKKNMSLRSENSKLTKDIAWDRRAKKQLKKMKTN